MFACICIYINREVSEHYYVYICIHAYYIYTISMYIHIYIIYTTLGLNLNEHGIILPLPSYMCACSVCIGLDLNEHDII